MRRRGLGWPRGRYNGRRIVGVEVRVRIDVLDWDLAWFGRYGSAARLGPIFLWLEWTYRWA